MTAEQKRLIAQAIRRIRDGEYDKAVVLLQKAMSG